MLSRAIARFAVVGAFALLLAGCSALTHADEITISAESFGLPKAPAAAPQPIALPAMPQGAGAAPKTGG